MSEIRVLVADDEAPARERLVRLLAESDDALVVGEAATGVEAIEQVRALKPHVIFLDIHMPPPSGLEAARVLLDLPDPPMVIFLTAHREHAVEAFELNAFDYMVKPVRAERLATCLERVREALQGEDRWQRLLVETVRKALPDRDRSPLDRIAVKERDSETREIVEVKIVDYFSSENERTYAHLRGRSFDVGQSLTRLEAMLPDTQFMRTHRAYIVNVNAVTCLQPWFHGAYNLTLRGGQEIPLSRSYVAAFRERVPWV